MGFMCLFRSDSERSGNGAVHTSISIPLAEVPVAVLEEHPGLAPQRYDPQLGDTCSMAMAVPHNACRAEMVDMCCDMLPSLHAQVPLSSDVAEKLSLWWEGFARLALTTSLVDDYLAQLLLGDVLADFDREAVAIAKAVKRIREKNGNTLEVAMRATSKAVSALQEERTPDAVRHLSLCWRQTVAILCGIYTLVEETAEAVEVWRRGDTAVHVGLERRVAAFYTDSKRWGNRRRRAELVVMLCSWMGNEHVMRDWTKRTLDKRDVRAFGGWLDEYGAGRVEVVDSFRRLAS